MELVTRKKWLLQLPCGLRMFWMVEAGTIEKDRATRIFEAAREGLVGKWIEEDSRVKPMR